MIPGNAASHLVDRHLDEGRGSRIAFIDGGGAHTYGDLSRMANQAGNLLLGLGIARGERVALCLNDSISFPALFFGALKIGAVPVPLNTLLTTDDYTFMLRDSGAVAAITSVGLCDRFEPAASDIIDHSRMLIEGGGWAPYSALEAELAIADEHLRPVTVGEDEPGFGSIPQAAPASQRV